MTTTTARQSRFNRIAFTLTAAAVVALAHWGGNDTEPAPTTQLATVAHDVPTVECWTEWKADGTTEPIMGNGELAPAGSTPLDCAAFGEPAGKRVQEDDPRWDCRTMGNHVCSPTDEPRHKAGCYHDGQLVTAWSRYDQPTADPLYTHRLDTPPCDTGKLVARTAKAPVAQKPKVQGPAFTVRAEDGTRVPVSFYSETDYNRDGLVDQTGKPIGR